MGFPATPPGLPSPRPTPPHFSLLVGRLGEAEGRFSDGFWLNCERTPRAAQGREFGWSLTQHLRGEWPEAKVRRGGSSYLPQELPPGGSHGRRDFRPPSRSAACWVLGRSALSLADLGARASQFHLAEVPYSPSCRLCNSFLSGHSYFFPARTCGAQTPSYCRSPPRVPHFRYPRLLGNQGSAARVTAPFLWWPS